MPFYEYVAIDKKKSCKQCSEIFEVRQSILDKPIKKCSECGNLIERLISLISGSIYKNRQMNQFSEVKYAKHWIDKDGNKHKVTQADGSVHSPTVSNKRQRTDEEVAIIEKNRSESDRKRRNKESKARLRRRTK